jgi:hypothetical protein
MTSTIFGKSTWKIRPSLINTLRRFRAMRGQSSRQSNLRLVKLKRWRTGSTKESRRLSIKKKNCLISKKESTLKRLEDKSWRLTTWNSNCRRLRMSCKSIKIVDLIYKRTKICRWLWTNLWSVRETTRKSKYWITNWLNAKIKWRKICSLLTRNTRSHSSRSRNKMRTSRRLSSKFQSSSSASRHFPHSSKRRAESKSLISCQSRNCLPCIVN